MIWVCYHYYGAFCAHLLIVEYPYHHQNLISSSLYYPGPLHKVSSQSVYNLFSNVVQRQTNRQTNAPENITSFAKEVIKPVELFGFEPQSGQPWGAKMTGPRLTKTMQKQCTK